jgi:hypothetical protein
MGGDDAATPSHKKGLRGARGAGICADVGARLGRQSDSQHAQPTTELQQKHSTSGKVAAPVGCGWYIVVDPQIVGIQCNMSVALPHVRIMSLGKMQHVVFHCPLVTTSCALLLYDVHIRYARMACGMWQRT